jgi:hypothetical protein
LLFAMRRIAADYIFPVSGPPLKNGIIEFDPQGRIISVTDTGGDFKETSRLEYYNGILVPGLIIPCCRIEPYIFQTEIPNYAGLKRFITRKLDKFKLSPDADTRFKSLDINLQKSGIRGIGCITNRFHFFRNKSEGKIWYHSFVEIFPEKKSDAFESFNAAVEDIIIGWNDYGLPSSIIPFDFCTEEEIMTHISDFSTVHDNPLILGCPGMENDPFSILKKFSSILSRCTGKEESQALSTFRNPVMIVTDNLSGLAEVLNNNTFILFPTDNLCLIDNQLIEKDFWIRFSENLLFTRHLLCFNTKVPLISDLINLQLKIPWLSFDDLIKCFTLNPARALRMDRQAGSFVPGKIPGINLITNFDFDEFKLTDKSEIKPII